MVIFNEREYVANMIKAHKKEPKLSFNTFLKYLIKYYYPEYKDKTVQEYTQKILDVVNSFEFDTYLYQEYEHYGYIKRMCKKAQKGEMRAELRDFDSIKITKAEMEVIAKGKTNDEQKVLFTLYVLAKLFSYHSGWVNYAPSEIFKLANIYKSWRERFLIINSLYEAGLIQLNHVIGKTGYKVELHEDSETVITVTQSKDFGKQYIAAVKPDWMICEKCGRLTKKKAPNQKYCKKCAEATHKQQKLDSQSKIRTK